MKIYNNVSSNKDEIKVSQKLKIGLDKVANAVKSTLGPAGNTVIIDTIYAGTITTKDGVTVAKEITLEDEVENVAASMLKTVAEKTVNEAGDGTTTATILAQALFNEGLKILPFIKNRNDLKRSIEKYSKEVIEYIKSQSIPVSLDKEGLNTDLFNIAKVSSNGDEEMANIIVKAFCLVGENGIISVDDGIEDGYLVEKIDGLRVDAGMAHLYFMTDARKQESEQTNVNVLLIKDGVPSLQPYVGILEKVAGKGESISIISADFTEQVINIALQNKLKGKVNINLIKVQGYGSNRDATFEDIASITGATIIDANIKSEEYINCLGKAKKIISNKNESRIISESKDEVRFNEHIETLKTQMSNCSAKRDIEKYEERISKLLGGVAIIKVGGKTEKESREAKDRLDDAINAVRSALEEGYVPGAGTVFFKAAYNLKDDDSEGYKVIKEVLQSPLKTLSENSGESFEYIKSLLLNIYNSDIKSNSNSDQHYGINFAKPDVKITNLVEEGIIDPAKVLRVALQSAVSIANLLLTSDTVITQHQDNTTGPEMPNM